MQKDKVFHKIPHTISNICQALIFRKTWNQQICKRIFAIKSANKTAMGTKLGEKICNHKYNVLQRKKRLVIIVVAFFMTVICGRVSLSSTSQTWAIFFLFSFLSCKKNVKVIYFRSVLLVSSNLPKNQRIFLMISAGRRSNKNISVGESK